jgi:SAM-dependent MidA family methyltransferase
LKELGPGRGLLAQDLLDWSEKIFPQFFRALGYVLVEQSGALRERIGLTLSRHFESGKARFGSTESSADSPTIVLANEFFDALPVDIASSKGALRIGVDRGHFVESWAPASPEELEFLDRYSIHPEEGERVEVPLEGQKCIVSASRFERGFFVVIDYGYTREEQLAGRHRGTVKAIRQHSISANPYEAPGEQDITADVNFTALAAVAEKQGLHAQRVITQSQFLMGIGEANQFADAFQDCRLPQERAKVALQLKHLVTPAGMGESFHVLVASKGMEREKVGELAGLSFGRRDLASRRAY